MSMACKTACFASFMEPLMVAPAAAACPPPPSRAHTAVALTRGPVRLGDLTLRLSDTAGLRQSDDPVEQIGVERSRRALAQCDLILAVFDESRPLTPEEREWLPQLSGRAAVVIYNKQDLPSALTAAEKAEIAAVVPTAVSISAAAGTGLAELTEAIRQVVGLSHFAACFFLAVAVVASKSSILIIAVLDINE